MDITRRSTPKSDWLYSLQPKMEKLCTVSKNKTRSWLWLRSWTPYCQIQISNVRNNKDTRSLEYIEGGSDGKESACSAGDLGWEDPLKKGMATHSSILAWRIPWTEGHDGPQSMVSWTVGHNWVNVSVQLGCFGERNCLIMQVAEMRDADKRRVNWKWKKTYVCKSN